MSFLYNNSTSTTSSLQTASADPPVQPTTPDRNLDDFRVIVILDASGSMLNIRSDMLGSLNTFIRKQKEDDAKQNIVSRFTMLQFNNAITYIQTDKLMSEVDELTEKDYVVTGCTALYDAIADAIRKFQDCRRVACVIVTDGLENASHKFNKAQVTEMITRQKTAHDWQFIYMSQDEAGFQEGAQIGVTSNMTVGKYSFGSTMHTTISSEVTTHKSRACETNRSGF